MTPDEPPATPRSDAPGEPSSRKPLGSDADALAPLIDTMRAASRHDRDGTVAGLDQAAGHLPPGRFHRSRADIDAARTAADAGEWVRVWHHAYEAIVGLTWTFPPDMMSLPPVPAATPLGGACPTCGQPQPGRFCANDGTKLAD